VYHRSMKLDFIRAGKPTEHGTIESFNEQLRDECLIVTLITSLKDAKTKIEAWRIAYNRHRSYG
jgi:putative transposase